MTKMALPVHSGTLVGSCDAWWCIISERRPFLTAAILFGAGFSGPVLVSAATYFPAPSTSLPAREACFALPSLLLLLISRQQSRLASSGYLRLLRSSLLLRGVRDSRQSLSASCVPVGNARCSHCFFSLVSAFHRAGNGCDDASTASSMHAASSSSAARLLSCVAQHSSGFLRRCRSSHLLRRLTCDSRRCCCLCFLFAAYVLRSSARSAAFRYPLCFRWRASRRASTH